MCKCNMWFQKVSIPPPQRGLEIPRGCGWGGGGIQRPRKFKSGAGLEDKNRFPRG